MRWLRHGILQRRPVCERRLLAARLLYCVRRKSAGLIWLKRCSRRERASSSISITDAFASHRFEIELAAQRMLNELRGKPVLLHSGYFRFCT
jgi:hypothetical protein